MAGSVSKTIIIGNCGSDPRVYTFPDGNRVVSFSVATSERWKNKQTGEQQERTEWHRIVVKNSKLGEIAERYIRKGSKVYIEGENQTRKYEKGGVEFQTTEVVLPMFRGAITLLDSRNANGGEERNEIPAVASGGSGGGGAAQRGNVPDLDDEIPF